MSDYSLKDLADDDVFERLCKDLLLAEGCKNARGIGSGADQGKDIMVDVEYQAPVGTVLLPFIVQCKWTTDVVGQDQISNTVDYLSTHRARGLLMITSSHFSGTAVTKADSISRDTSNPYHVHLWDGSEVHRRLNGHPSLIAKYWYRTAEGKYLGRPSADVFPRYDESVMRNELIAPSSYDSASAEWYSRSDYCSSVRERILACARAFQTSPPVITVIRGAIGSGKSYLANFLLAHAPAQDKGFLGHYTFEQCYYSYLTYGDSRLPRLLAVLSDVGFLVIDDFGYGTHGHGPVNFLIDLVRLRIKEERVTILVEATPTGEFSEEAQPFLSLMSQQYPTIDLADRDWRGAPSEHAEISARGSEESYSGFLGRGWIGSKLQGVETLIEHACALLAMSDEEIRAESRERTERGFEPVTQADLVRETLLSTRKTLAGYRDFIEMLPWDSIHFADVPVRHPYPYPSGKQFSVTRKDLEQLRGHLSIETEDDE